MDRCNSYDCSAFGDSSNHRQIYFNIYDGIDVCHIFSPGPESCVCCMGCSQPSSLCKTKACNYVCYHSTVIWILGVSAFRRDGWRSTQNPDDSTMVATIVA